MPMELFWLVALIVFAILEAITFGLTSIWFCLGALAAIIASALNAPLWLQIVLFLVISAASIALVRPLARKYLIPRQVRTNADRVLGMDGVVTETIDNMAAAGLVSVGGNIWTARSESGVVLEKNTLVHVLRIEGVKLYVRPADTEKPVPGI